MHLEAKPMAESARKSGNEQVYRMAFGAVYFLFAQKAEGRPMEKILRK